MAYPSVFEEKTNQEMLKRLDNLRVDSQPDWGKMNSAQMLRHCNVAYELADGRKTSKVSPFKRSILRMLLKPIVTSDKPYKKNSRTAPVFLVSDKQDFEKEKKALQENIKKVQEQGEDHFEGKPSISFGKMTAKEWSTQFQKHLEHHFKQFGI